MRYSVAFTTTIVFLAFHKTCYSAPVFGFLFGDENESEGTAATADNTDGKVQNKPVDSVSSIVVPAAKKEPSPSSIPPFPDPVKNEIEPKKEASSSSSSAGKRNERPSSAVASVPGDAVGFIAGTLGRGIRGIKGLIDSSTSGTKNVIQRVEDVQNSAFDNMQQALDSRVNRTLDQVSSWASRLDMYRRALSGSVKKNVDKGHSITITTASDAPMNTLVGLMNKYMPADNKAASAPVPMPEITSIDFSNFWGRK